MEIAGCLFNAVGCIFMRNLYTLSNYGLSGVLFGSVNSSPWEYAKTLFLPYLAWSMLELLCLGKGLHRLAVVKASSMCLLLGLYLSLSTVLNGKNSELLIASVSVLTAQIFSYILSKSHLNLESLFPAALCTLFLLLAFYFSFTPFPPKNQLFADKISGQYGIPPIGYDFGADALFTIIK